MLQCIKIRQFSRHQLTLKVDGNRLIQNMPLAITKVPCIVENGESLPQPEKNPRGSYLQRIRLQPILVLKFPPERGYQTFKEIQPSNLSLMNAKILVHSFEVRGKRIPHEDKFGPSYHDVSKDRVRLRRLAKDRTKSLLPRRPAHMRALEHVFVSFQLLAHRTVGGDISVPLGDARSSRQ